MNEPLVIVAARSPLAGAMPRLCPPLNAAQARAAYAAMVADALDVAASVRAADTWLVTPLNPSPDLAALVPATARLLGIDGDSPADRSHAAFAMGFLEGYRRIALLPADAPDLPAAYITTAFDRLDEDPSLTVTVPASDGSCCLLAMARPRPELFSGVRWGISSTMASVQAVCERLRLPLCTLPEWQTVQTHADLLDCVARGRAANLLALSSVGVLSPEAAA